MKKKENKVTIVVPIYNVEQYLPKCLDSLINQTLKDIEIMAISDGSPDNSVEIIKEYSKKDKRVKCIEKENGGYGSVLEYAIKNMTTKYFLICDPDDWLKEDAIETLYNLAEKNDLDITVGAKYLVYNDNSEEEYCDSKESFCRVKENKIYEGKAINEFNFLHVSPHSKLYKTEIAKNINFPHKVSFTDLLLYIIALNNAKKVMYTSKALSYYLIDRPGNSMTDTKPKVFDYHITVFTSIIEQLNKMKKPLKMSYVRMYYQYRGVISIFKNSSVKTDNEYKTKLKDILDLLSNKKNLIINNAFYESIKRKIFAYLLISKKTRNKMFERLIK